jgi:hypothetical protein
MINIRPNICENMRHLLLTLLIAQLIFISCENESKTEDDPGQKLIFQSLTAEKDTIEAGETTQVTAIASGYQLSYYWSASAGDILGSGSKILYASSPCNAGKNQITCKVKDGNNQEQAKTISIVVQ